MSAQLPSRKSLTEQLQDEARELSEKYGIDYEEVYECEMAMFCHHAATGGDRDCTCGAHKAAGEEWLAAHPQYVHNYGEAVTSDDRDVANREERHVVQQRLLGGFLRSGVTHTRRH